MAIEERALALVNEVKTERGLPLANFRFIDRYRGREIAL